ncbi:hypothetical protein HPB49_022745 [Dermacentor silvarum]|uniref:Uncharacterized protein n=1 Tax=Dermacentor silvarum TaxID=543639 RepID=A0ACB8DRK6_DERSI|nr:hypothetical protein HPB49_022745 [Dermacentor silvarum]
MATCLAELVALGERIGLQGAKLSAWADEQTAQAHEEVLAERDAAKTQLELETRILGLQMKLAEQELRQIGIKMGLTGPDLKWWVQSKLEALEQGKDVPFEFVNEIKEREERILQLRHKLDEAEHILSSMLTSFCNDEEEAIEVPGLKQVVPMVELGHNTDEQTELKIRDLVSSNRALTNVLKDLSDESGLMTANEKTTAGMRHHIESALGSIPRYQGSTEEDFEPL